MVEKGMSCVKYMLFAFNLLFFIFGLALVGVGIFVQVELNKYFDFFSSNVNATAILIIVVGAITLIVGFFGCCGAIKENHCMIMTFAALISIILICEIGGGIAAYVLRGKVNDIVKQGMEKSMQNYDGNFSADGVAAVWDGVQREFKCCGTENASDWTNLGKPIPASCCDEKALVCLKETAYKKGCLTSIEDFVAKNILYVAGVAVALGVVELVGIVLACCLGRAIKRESAYA